MQIHCLRHGVTESNLTGRFNGRVDESITDHQARALLQLFFDADRYDQVFCSPLKRCLETALALGITNPVLDERLVERHLGIFQELTAAECAARYPDEFGRFQQLDADYRIPLGESRAENLARVVSWIEDLGGSNTVLAVTHGGTIDFLYRMASALPLHGGNVVHAGSNAALSMFEVDWPAVGLIAFDQPIDVVMDSSPANED